MQNEGFKYIGVSKVACKGFEAKTGNKCELIYNPVPIEKPKVEKKPGLHLISVTRLTSEKGGKRIEKLSKILDKANIEYDWTIYTNKYKKYKSRLTSPNIILKPQQLDIAKEVAKASFLVQLSDCESFGLSVCEALILGTPVIITDLEAFKEIGCKHGENAVVCNLDMTNVDVEMIKKGLTGFKYSPPKSEWGKYLSKTGKYNPNEKVKVKVKITYTDIVLGKKLKRGDELEQPKARASYLEARDLVEVFR